MPDWRDHPPGLGPSFSTQVMWQMAHQVQVEQAANAMASAVANANAQAQATQQLRASVIAALEMHMTSLVPAVAANPDAMMHLQAAQALVTQLA